MCLWNPNYNICHSFIAKYHCSQTSAHMPNSLVTLKNLLQIVIASQTSAPMLTTFVTLLKLFVVKLKFTVHECWMCSNVFIHVIFEFYHSCHCHHRFFWLCLKVCNQVTTSYVLKVTCSSDLHAHQTCCDRAPHRWYQTGRPACSSHLLPEPPSAPAAGAAICTTFSTPVRAICINKCCSMTR